MRTLKVPFAIDSRGGLAFTESTQDIVEQQITDIVVTGQYERVMNPLYGAGVPQFLFAPTIAALLRTKANEISAILSATVTLATIVAVNLSAIPGRSAALSLDVRYTITPSPTVFTINRTITGVVTEETFGQVL